ncbi:THxN family PEP-CTERM protein [Paracoccus sp. (in: a-proteobacteria)]|uniref:THxN family PEP-CTERM protein n=1 Tax=Paracoccus sp. TaxID=267 RepID=UPI0026DEE43C|nr:THxN family PEP-CTERM protein [Paracoccus sp. (in: a-proteobacteria)]MDO5648405.1 THxN family PEP-CTERM protein [Paracoccus sp. (in: a-proteobacteria)]
MSTKNAIAGALVALLGATAGASAATVVVENVTGAWTNIVGGGTAVTGRNTNEIFWGVQTATPKSGLSFAGVSNKAMTAGTVAELGSLTHHNFFTVGTPVSAARLNLSFDVRIDGELRTVTNAYDFTLLETRNNSRICDNGEPNRQGININGCADRMQAIHNADVSETFEIGGKTFVFDIDHFGFDLDADGIPTIWTAEELQTRVSLTAQFIEIADVAPVPLPASAALLVAGLGGFAALRRRKKA